MHFFFRSAGLVGFWLFVFGSPASSVFCQEVADGKSMRLGMIGLDTSHVPAFAKVLNDPQATGNLARMDVVAAFPGGSPDLPSSRDRVAGYTAELEKMGIEIVDSIELLLTKVDAVLLESVDGRPHLQQAIPVIKARKPLYIDKPLAGSLADALAIDLLAKKYDSRWFSSSSLRFSPSIHKYRTDPEWKGKVVGAMAWSPCPLEDTHPDLFWYGIHGVESLYTAMGSGCSSVSRTYTPGSDIVSGTWIDGRIGTFRGIRDGRQDYGLIVFGRDKIDTTAKYEGYEPLVRAIADFFAGGPVPIEPSETIELMAFMTAAQRSRERSGQSVTIAEVMEEANRQAASRIVNE